MFLVNDAQPISRRVRRRGSWTVLLAAALAVLAGGWAGTAGAKIVREKEDPASDPRWVFEQIALAWEAADVETLAGFIHADGLRVTNLQVGERVSHYSPSQAHYFFRNLFQAHRTLVFEFTMTQDRTEGARVHGMATWKRRRPDSEDIEVIKLVCVLAQQDGRWKLAEINTIR